MNMDNTWYLNVFIKYRKETLATSLFVLTLSLSYTTWQFILGHNFVWKDIELISAPDIFDRYFYSALSFVTVGAILYFIRFYQLLHILTVELMGSWELYKTIKKVIWFFLMLLSFFTFQHVVDLINKVISFIYNTIIFALFISPPLLFSLTFSITLYVLMFKKKHYALLNK